MPDGLQEVAAYGVRVRLPAAPPQPIWPENWRPVRLFESVQNQWRPGLGALDYASLPAWCGPAAGSRRGRRIFDAVRVMEAEAVRILRARGAGRE